MSQKGGKQPYKGRLEKDRSQGGSSHSFASADCPSPPKHAFLELTTSACA